jgi:uncharacterized membrane protein
MKLLLTRQSSLVRKVAFGGIFAALSFVVTFFLPVPLASLIGGSGYLNLGDSVSILAGILSTSVYAPFGAALGAAISDFALGYVHYAPFTFLIKLMEALAAGILFRALAKRVSTPERPGRSGLPQMPSLIIASVFGGLLMAVGYFVAEATFLVLLDPTLGWVTAIKDFPWNALQGAAGALVAILLYPVVSRAAPEA